MDSRLRHVPLQLQHWDLAGNYRQHLLANAIALTGSVHAALQGSTLAAVQAALQAAAPTAPALMIG
jgi:hypothetical protein